LSFIPSTSSKFLKTKTANRFPTSKRFRINLPNPKMVKSKLIYIYSYPWKLENSSNFHNFYLPHFAAKYVVADVILDKLIWFLLLNSDAHLCSFLPRNLYLPCRVTPVTNHLSLKSVNLYALQQSSIWLQMDRLVLTLRLWNFHTQKFWNWANISAAHY